MFDGVKDVFSGSINTSSGGDQVNSIPESDDEDTGVKVFMEKSGKENKIYSDITGDDLSAEFSDILDDAIDKNIPPYICRKGCKYYETDKNNGEIIESCWLTNEKIYNGFICLVVEPKQNKLPVEVLTFRCDEKCFFHLQLFNSGQL